MVRPSKKIQDKFVASIHEEVVDLKVETDSAEEAVVQKKGRGGQVEAKIGRNYNTKWKI